MTTRKTRRENFVKFEIFAECARLEKTPFWKAKFEDFSKGHFPKGFAYKDKVLSYKRLRRKVLQKVDIPEDPQEAADVVKTFMRNETGTLPVDEIVRKKIDMSIALKQNLVPDTIKWKDMRAPTIKRQMILAYVYNYVESGSLTEMEARNLTSVIISGIAIKAIKPEDVILKDGKIIDITGIDHNQNGFYLVSVPENIGSFVSETGKPLKQTYGCAKWDKMCEQYDTYVRTGSTVK
jgi:hypothetical protein